MKIMGKSKWLAWMLAAALVLALVPTSGLQARAASPRTIVYHINGGTGTAPADAAVYDTAPYRATILGPGEGGGSVTPPAGKRFAGWSPLESGVANEWYAPGKQVVVSANGLDLYAMWEEEKVSYTVKFRTKIANVPAPPDQTVVAGGPVANPGALSCAGYTFVGWYRDSSFRAAWDFDGDRVNGDLTLHAKWAQDGITPWTVTYHLLPGVKTNGGPGVPPSPTTTENPNGGNVRVQNIVPGTALEGKVFAGWSTSPGRVLELKYRPGTDTSDYVAVKYEGVDLYDVWVDENPAYSNAVTVDFDDDHQTMAGLGNALAFNKTSGYLQVYKKFQQLGVADADNPAIRALHFAVDDETGAKLEVFRAIIGDGGVTAPDINPATGEKYEWGNRYYDGPNDTCWPEPGADNIIWKKADWAAQKDKFDANQIWYIQKALEVNPGLKVYGAVWSPPYWMKTNLGVRNDTPDNPNGQPKTTYPLLDDAYYADFATYLCEWAWGMYAYYGIPIYAVSPTNEPEIDHGYSAMVIRGDDYERFLLTYLKPTIQQYIYDGKFGAAPSGAGTGAAAVAPVMGVAAPEATRIDRSTSPVDLGTPDRPGYGGMMAKDEIADMVSVFTTHMYENDHFLYEPRVASDDDPVYPAFMNKYRDKDIWMTEIGQQFPAYNEQGAVDNFSMVNGLFWARRIANEFASNPGFSSYILWNGTGSAGVTNDTARWINMLNAGSGQGTLPTLTGQLRIYKRYYAVAQFSRFIHPGDVRVGADRTPFKGANVTAYRSADGKDFSIVALNEDSVDHTVAIDLKNYGGSAARIIPYRTSDRENMRRLDPIDATGGGVFLVNLPALSITTFVNDKGAANLPGMNARDVFTILEAEDNDGQAGASAAAGGVSLSDGGYVKYANFNFADGTGVPSANVHVLRMKAAGRTDAAGKLEVRIDDQAGRVVGVFLLTPSASATAYYAQIDTGDLGAYGFKDFYLVYSGEGEVYLDQFTFDATPASDVSNLVVNGLGTTNNNTDGWTGRDVTLASVNNLYYRGRSLSVTAGGEGKGPEASLQTLPQAGAACKLNAFVIPAFPAYSKASAYDSGLVNGGTAKAILRFYDGETLVFSQEIASRAGINNVDWRQLTGMFVYNPPSVDFDAVKLLFTLSEDVPWYIDEVTLTEADVPTYTVTFDTQGGTDVPPLPGVERGATIDAPSPVPTKAGSTFAGWYKEAALTTPWNFASDTVTADVTLFAKWTVAGGGGGGSPVTAWLYGQVDGGRTLSETPFTDVGGHWAYEDIEYAYKAGWMNGTSASKFSPDIRTERGMIVTVLWRIEGSPAPAAAAFDDVEAGAYYAQAVAWAAEHDVVNGVGGGLFAPLRQVTREQVATILYRYAQYKQYDVSAQGDLSAFPDATSVSGYEDARASAAWAVGAELLRGRASGVLDPRGTATRAELAALLHRFHTAFATRASESRSH